MPFAMMAGSMAVPAGAQPVVQALPPREAGQLNAALKQLAARPRDLEALLSAGNASLALRDGPAAASFFARAAQIAPNDARVLLGTARAALQQRRPLPALNAFAAAEQAGARPLDMAADRGLAYDLVGDGAAAQALYRSVLLQGDSAAIRMRLAISLAIAGNRSEFDRVLYPLLKTEDRAAFRTRAFGLAILGRTDDAVGIADAMMPTDLALRMAPYLRYMPRLTRAQQAAAANLGAFPAAADIGRDSSDITAYSAAGARIAARSDTALTPAGRPLGVQRTSPAPVARTPTTAATPGPAITRSAAPRSRTGSEAAPGFSVPVTSPALARNSGAVVPRTRMAPVASAVRVAEAELPPVASAPSPTPPIAIGRPVAASQPPSAPVRIELPAQSVATPSLAVRAQQPNTSPSAAASPVIAQATLSPPPNLVLPGEPNAPAVIVATQLPASSPPVSQAENDDRPSLEEAFAEFGTAPRPAPPAATGAVDVAALAAARAQADREAESRARAARAAEARAEKARADKARAEQAKADKVKAELARAEKARAEKERQEKAALAAEPARYWLQVAVGRNTAAFAFDWKKLARDASGLLDGKGPWTAKYGATNRMLAGPYPTDAAARAALRKLKEKGIDALPFRSDAGEKVAKAG